MRGDQLVKGERFNSWRSVGLVAQAVKTHQRRGVDELLLLDIDATPSGRGPNFGAIERLVDNCFSPITVGGGVKTVADVKKMLACGADKVAIRTSTEIIRECARRFGSQAIVAAIDVYPHTPTVELALALEDMGAGEILLTSVDREGTLAGYDLETITAVSHKVKVPVIAHGGCGTYLHMLDAVAAGASAVAAGAMFCFTEQTPKGAARYLASRGIETRVE